MGRFSVLYALLGLALLSASGAFRAANLLNGRRAQTGATTGAAPSVAHPTRLSSFVAPRRVASRSSLQMVSTAPMPKLDSMQTGGMFTNSSPETKRVVPTNMEGKTRFKIVYVVLESQYQSSLTKACNSINDGKEGVAIEAVGYLLEELRDPANLEKFKADVADANIFIGSLIFVQELADKVRYTLPPIF